jgi:hypothetical protein
MTALFVTQVCDYCDYGPAVDKLYCGFVVYRLDLQYPQDEYVFRTAMDADRWRAAAGRDGCEIYKVYSLMPFQWHLSQGTLRDVVLADHMFEVHSSHRYEPLSYRCFITEKQTNITAPAPAPSEDQVDIPF